MNNKTISFLYLLAGIILVTSFAIAIQYVIPTTFNTVNESISNFYNITINNSAVGSVNITQVNITLPSGFRFTATSNGSSTSTGDFSNTSLVLTWSNYTDFVVQNVSNQSFWFNATANTTTIGTFYFNVSLVNSTGVTYFDIPVTVNDTTAPFVNVSTPGNNSNISSMNITVVANDNVGIGVIILHVFNASMFESNTTGTASPFVGNITGLVNGTYFVNVTVNDSARNLNQSSTLIYNFDGTVPAIAFVSPTSSYTITNLSSSSIEANVTASDVGFGLSSINLTLYYANGTLVNGSFSATSPLYMKTQGLSQGIYYLNATANDTRVNNKNYTVTKTIVLDTTAPSVSVSRSSSSTQTKIVASVTTTESGSNISSCGVDSTVASPNSWTGLTQTVTETGLQCGNAYSRVFSCTDNAGNVGNVTKSLSTDDCTTTSSSSSSSTTSSDIVWTSTYAQDSKELSTVGSVTQSLAAKERVRVKIGTEKHYVGVSSVSSSSASIEVSSSPQTATLKVGETKKFELTNDTFYDMSVTLDSIKNSKANVTITSIHEAMTVAQVVDSNVAKVAGANRTAQQNSSITSAPTTQGAKTWLWWALGVLVVLVIIAVIWTVARKNK